jgi:hypothetical protein
MANIAKPLVTALSAFAALASLGACSHAAGRDAVQVQGSASNGSLQESTTVSTSGGTGSPITTSGPPVPNDLLTLEQGAARQLGDAQPTSVQVVATTFDHAEGVLFSDSSVATRSNTQPVWVVIMKGQFTNTSAQLPPNATVPTGDTSVAVYSQEQGHILLDSWIGQTSRTAAALNAPITTVSW